MTGRGMAHPLRTDRSPACLSPCVRLRYRTQRFIPSVNETVLQLISRPMRHGLRRRIGQKLRLVQWQGAFDGLELEDHLAVHDDVGSVAAIDEDIVIKRWERYSALECDARFIELVSKALFIDRFKQAGTETAVHAHRQSDDSVGKVAAVAEAVAHGARAWCQSA